MVNKEFYIQQADEDGTGLSKLIKTLGNTKTVSAGWSVWALKTFSVSFGSAAVAGFSCQMAMAPLFGPILPFLVASTVGFAGGMYHRWYFDSREALHALKEFPELMAHHLMLLGPSTWSTLDMDEWRKDINRNYMKQSLAIAALYGASDMIARIRAEKEEQLFRKYTAEYASE